MGRGPSAEKIPLSHGPLASLCGIFLVESRAEAHRGWCYSWPGGSDGLRRQVEHVNMALSCCVASLSDGPVLCV